MHFRIRGTVIALAACLPAGAARAGDDGAAPLWEGIGSIFAPLVGLSHDDKAAIEYREHGKIVVPKSMDLPQPSASPAVTGGAWPVDQEVQRKAIAKEQEKKKIAGVGDARLRYTHPFPNAPVTVGAADQPDGGTTDQANGGKAESSSPLGNLNPLGWVGIGKSTQARSRTGSGMVNGSAEGLPGARGCRRATARTVASAEWTGVELTASPVESNRIGGPCRFGAWRTDEKQLSCYQESPHLALLIGASNGAAARRSRTGPLD